MAERNFVPSLVTYNAVSNELCLCKNYRGVHALVGKMILSGLLPDAVTYRTLIAGYAEEGRAVDSRKALEEMMKNGFLPDNFSYNHVINCLCKAGKMEEASPYVFEMVEKGLSPNAVTFGAFICGYGKAGNMLEADRFFHYMLDRSFDFGSSIWVMLLILMTPLLLPCSLDLVILTFNASFGGTGQLPLIYYTLV